MGKRIFSGVIIALFFYIALPLALPVALGAIFAVLFFPSLQYLEKRKFGTHTASAVITISVTLLILLPAILLIFMGAKTGLQQLKTLRDAPIPQGATGNVYDSLVHTPAIHSLIESIARWFPIEVDEIVTTAGEAARGIVARILEFFGDIVTRLPAMAMGLVIMVLSIYFFLADSRRLILYIRTHSVFDPIQTEVLIKNFVGMCRSVVLATVISGLAQSFLFSLACVAVGRDDVPLIGFLVFLASFIPLLGSAPVTFGVAIHELLLQDHKTIGIILLVVAGLVSIIDNFIRPVVLKGSANLHPLLAFIAAFGGLQVLGFSGVFLGPIIAGLFVVTLDNLMKGSNLSERL